MCADYETVSPTKAAGGRRHWCRKFSQAGRVTGNLGAASSAAIDIAEQTPEELKPHLLPAVMPLPGLAQQVVASCDCRHDPARSRVNDSCDVVALFPRCLDGLMIETCLPSLNWNSHIQGGGVELIMKLSLFSRAYALPTDEVHASLQAAAGGDSDRAGRLCTSFAAYCSSAMGLWTSNSSQV